MMQHVQIVYMGYRVEFELKVLDTEVHSAVERLRSFLELDATEAGYQIRITDAEGNGNIVDDFS